MLETIKTEVLHTVCGGQKRGCVIRPEPKCKPGNTGITGGMNVTNNDVPSRCR